MAPPEWLTTLRDKIKRNSKRNSTITTPGDTSQKTLPPIPQPLPAQPSSSRSSRAQPPKAEQDCEAPVKDEGVVASAKAESSTADPNISPAQATQSSAGKGEIVNASPAPNTSPGNATEQSDGQMTEFESPQGTPSPPFPASTPDRPDQPDQTAEGSSSTTDREWDARASQTLQNLYNLGFDIRGVSLLAPAVVLFKRRHEHVDVFDRLLRVADDKVTALLSALNREGTEGERWKEGALRQLMINIGPRLAELTYRIDNGVRLALVKYKVRLEVSLGESP